MVSRPTDNDDGNRNFSIESLVYVASQNNVQMSSL